MAQFPFHDPVRKLHQLAPAEKSPALAERLRKAGEEKLMPGEGWIVIPRTLFETALGDYAFAMRGISTDYSGSFPMPPGMDIELPTAVGACRLHEATRSAYERLLATQEESQLVFRGQFDRDDMADLTQSEARDRLLENGRVPLDAYVVPFLIGAHRGKRGVIADALGTEVLSPCCTQAYVSPIFTADGSYLSSWLCRSRFTRTKHLAITIPAP